MRRQAHRPRVGAVGNRCHDNHDDHDRASGQTVKAVGQVHSIAHAHEQDVHEDKIEPRDGEVANLRGQNAKVEVHDKRDVDGGLDAEEIHRDKTEDRRDEELPDKLRLRGKPERALLHDLLAVVGKTEGTGKHRRDDEGERLG